MALVQTQVPVWKEVLDNIREAYEEVVVGTGGALAYSAEQVFAVQACIKNDALALTATKNPDSLRLAMLNSAALGLTINPAEKLAYLVPRKGVVVLDISCRGLIKIAVDIGSIAWAKAELVYSKDRFRALGPGEKPEHEFDPFCDNRGELRGAYCVAKMRDGSWLTEFMGIKEIYKTRDCSSAWVKSKSGPWLTWEEEMIKKTVVKRGSKWWPSSESRLSAAINYLNEEAGEGLASLEETRDRHLVLAEKAFEPEKVSAETKKSVNTLVERAARSQMWAAAVQYANERLSGGDLEYALEKIKEAEKANSA